MKTMGAFEAKTNLSRLLHQVETHNEEIVITRRNRSVACLVPFGSWKTSKTDTRLAIVEGLRDIRKNQKTQKTLKIKALVENGRKR